MKPLHSTCKDCGAKLRGRSDKKFCNDYCRNSYNGKKNRDTTNQMRNINNILRKNRRILQTLVEKKGLKSSILELSHLGFRMEYCTQYLTDSQGRTRKFYYDFGIYEEEDYVLIVEPQENLTTSSQSKVI